MSKAEKPRTESEPLIANANELRAKAMDLGLYAELLRARARLLDDDAASTTTHLLPREIFDYIPPEQARAQAAASRSMAERAEVDAAGLHAEAEHPAGQKEMGIS